MQNAIKCKKNQAKNNSTQNTKQISKNMSIGGLFQKNKREKKDKEKKKKTMKKETLRQSSSYSELFMHSEK